MENLREGDHHGFASFKRETLATDIGRVEEILEALRLVQSTQDPVMRRGVFSPARKILHLLANPVTDVWILNVHVLDTQGAAVNGLHLPDDVANFHRSPIPVRSGADGLVEIRIRETKLLQLEQWLIGHLVTQRIEPRQGVTKGAVIVDQRLDTTFKR